ncbi:unnamed protein product [Darwinula stevensoni]|uniref:GPI alpha-1,4-mannosyltransferase I, catalytic subunit n=1 Tax=Darwinula stevensoni TaxID=69355 RepID=A0A7R9FQ76_9CRUS|nr:unnamed protein product [Darwinula stevensoni]CAG0898912.1 unnamed protein product [Darwinula stevensoni]
MSFWFHASSALAIRLGLVYYGKLQDEQFLVKYTDVDYHVYTDAARHVHEGGSPYDRHTYRYSPLLAYLMLPNLLLSPHFGKALFCLADILCGYLIHRMLRDRHGTKTATRCAWLWLYNPLPIVVSSRGNADSLVALLTLATVWFHQKGQVVKEGFVLGLAIHFKIFPVLYSLPLYLSLSDSKCDWKRALFPPNRKQVKLTLFTVLTFLALFVAFYASYGWDFVHETYLYHVMRRDTRHNFSAFFYLLYLSLPDTPRLLSFVLLLPQAVLVLQSALELYRPATLHLSLFLQTVVFVTFNKVVTSQYFLWYLALLPLVAPRLRLSVLHAAVLVVIWGFAQASWLLPAYFLEFEGRNVYLYVWIESLAFLCANIGVVGKLVKSYHVGDD